MTDQQIVDVLKRGNSTEEHYIVKNMMRNFRGIVYAIVIKYGYGKEEDLNNVLHDAITALVLQIKIGKVLLNNAKLSTIFYVIAKNKWLNMLREKQKLSNQGLVHNSESIINNLSNQSFEDYLKEEELKTAMQISLMKMEAVCFQIVYKYWFLGMALKDIALELGMSESAVKKRHERCKKKLKIHLIKEMKESDK